MGVQKNRLIEMVLLNTHNVPIPFQVNTVENIEVIRQNMFNDARVMVIGVGSDLNNYSGKQIRPR